MLRINFWARTNLLAVAFLIVLPTAQHFRALAQSTTCGASTVLDPSLNQCVCDSGFSSPDRREILIGGIIDRKSDKWAPDIFQVTVDLINQGFFPSLQLPADRTLTYELRNGACDENKALKKYWGLREAHPNGIVGCRCSGPTAQVARVSALDNIAQISPSSNSASLSNKEDFPLFSRLVAPNNGQGEVGATVTLMREFGWESVSVISTDTAFASDFVNEFRNEWVGQHQDSSGEWTGVVVSSETVRVDATTGLVDEASLHQVLTNIPENDPARSSRIILLAAHNQHAYRILEAATQQEFQPDTVWVGISSWVGRELTTKNAKWLPHTQMPGYLGVTILRNRDENYQRFFAAFQEWQTNQGREVFDELPIFAAETVDAIVAMTMAITASSDRSDGSEISKNLRILDFDGVSGRVQFSPDGDRLNNMYTVLNSQEVAIGDEIPWTDVGVVGTTVGTARLNDVCFREFGCKLENFPSDSYPALRIQLPQWVSISIFALVILLIAFAVKYWRSHVGKGKIRQELKAYRNSIVGMRTAACDYTPAIDNAGQDDIEQARMSDDTISNRATWCWKETDGRMAEHSDSSIHGDRKECWIKYDSVAAEALELAYNQRRTEALCGKYSVNLTNMVQTNLETKFQRHVLRVEKKASSLKRIDANKITIGDTPPAQLRGEPRMVLVENDVIQVSEQREDGWAFGTKLHHANEDLARRLISFATSSKDVDDLNIFVDSGWFQLSATRVPSSDDLEELQKAVGRVDASFLVEPKSWEPLQDPTIPQKHSLQEGHPERQAVINSFKKTLPGAKVIKVERIQNLAMYQTYLVKRSTVCYRETVKTNGDPVTAVKRFERAWLWHGTTVETVGKIINQGFNRSFCGRNATRFGKGVYFARDASYSASGSYSQPDAQGNKYILACRVCVGEYCQGVRDSLTPTVRDPATQSLYDSTVNSMNDPSVYVTYHDAQAYPEYLISFRTN